MKGGRPGIILTVLCPPGIQTELAELILLRETTTPGSEQTENSATILPRESLTASVADQKVSVKVARLGEEVITVAPEYRDCLRASEAAGLPLKEIHDRAKIAARTALGVH